MEEKNPRCTRSWLILPVSPMTVTVGPTACRVPGGPDGVKIVHLQRTPTYGLGIKITEHAEPGCKGCVIKAINNPALEQAGVLRVGQKICTVNGTRVDTMTLVQLTDMFKSLGSAQVGVVATDYMPPRITGTLKKKVNLFIAPIDIPAFNELDICATKRTAIDAAYRGKQFNRYLDILPNPSTAVPLKEIPMDPASTYINANYVRGHGVAQTPARHAGGHVPRNTYIAAQGPLPSTVASFIRMIWENDVKFIVQTTNFIENKKRKCERYFPSVIGAAGTREFDSISVTLTGTELRKGYKYSRLLFQKGSNKRNVEHFWFISWPDHGVPTDRLGRMYPNHVTDMLLHVRDRRKVGLVLWRVCLTCVAVSVFAAASPSPACRPHRQIGVSTAPGAVLIRLASPVPRCPLNGCAHRICAVKRMLPVHPQAVDNYASPLLVHCSAGVGRTGTFIVIDHVIAAIADKDRVDLIDIIKKCREDRMAIVQHTVQYKFAYQACINYAEIVMAASDGDIFAMESPSRKSLSKIDADPIYEATTDTDGTSLFRLRRGATSMKKTKEDKAVFEETPAAEEDVPAHESSSTNVLEDEPWYFGALSRDAMSAILKDSPVGSFGVRVSSQPGCFVLTFQQEDKQGHTKRLQSILIQPCTKPTGGSAFKLDQCSDRLFSSIVELVNYFITNAVSYIDDRTGVTHRLFLDNTLED
eukprot:m.290753 g.290753  ORF g.290753 m.290753 type:complete len:699 (+) comp19976_c0_seq20:1441-3537(+)